MPLFGFAAYSALYMLAMVPFTWLVSKWQQDCLPFIGETDEERFWRYRFVYAVFCCCWFAGWAAAPLIAELMQA